MIEIVAAVKRRLPDRPRRATATVGATVSYRGGSGTAVGRDVRSDFEDDLRVGRERDLSRGLVCAAQGAQCSRAPPRARSRHGPSTATSRTGAPGRCAYAGPLQGARSPGPIPQGGGLPQARPPRHRDRTRPHRPPQQRARHNAQCVTIQSRTAVTKFHGQRDNLGGLESPSRITRLLRIGRKQARRPLAGSPQFPGGANAFLDRIRCWYRPITAPGLVMKRWTRLPSC